MASSLLYDTYSRRVIGAAALDAATYEEVERDETATSQAFLP